MEDTTHIAPNVAHRFTSRTLAREYILGGRGMFTLVSGKTRKRFTFRVKGDAIYHVDRANDVVAIPSGLPARALAYLFGVLRPGAPDEVPAVLEIWHEGTCARCGRALTVPSSIQSGFGPVCGAKALGGVA